MASAFEVRGRLREWSRAKFGDVYRPSFSVKQICEFVEHELSRVCPSTQGVSDKEAYEKWLHDNGFAPEGIELDAEGGYVYVHDLWECWQGSRDAALEEAAKEIKQRFVERNQFGEMVYCADVEQVVRELKEQK